MGIRQTIVPEKAYDEFGRLFWDFYSKTGFAGEDKNELDCALYNILCITGFIHDTQPASQIAMQLHTTAEKVKKCKEYRFSGGEMYDKEKSRQCVCLISDAEVSGGKIVLTDDITGRLYMQQILQQSGFSGVLRVDKERVSMDLPTFVYIFAQIGGDAAALLYKMAEYPQIKDFTSEDMSADEILSALAVARQAFIEHKSDFGEKLSACPWDKMPDITKDVLHDAQDILRKQYRIRDWRQFLEEK